MDQAQLFRDRVRERDLDNFLIEELHASRTFREWFIGKLMPDFVAPADATVELCKSPPRQQDARQTDLQIGWYRGGELVGCVLIESKVTADFQPGQAAAYAAEVAVHRALLDTINDQDDDTNSAFVEFQFTERARQLLEKSEVYARLSREAIIRFQSRYSLRMYEIGAALYGKRDPTWTGEVGELRKLLHVPKDAYPNFSDFRKRVLEPARAEIDQLAEFTFSWQEHTSGRQVVRITMTFTAKPGRLALAAAEENDRHSAGRVASRKGDVESIVEPQQIAALISGAGRNLTADDLRWPSDDDVNDYSSSTAELYRIAVNDGAGHAVSRLSAAYVQHMGDTRFNLTGDRLRSSWTGFVKSKAATWKPVA